MPAKNISSKTSKTLANLLTFLNEYFDEHKISPSFQEILNAGHGGNSKSVVSNRLESLEGLGAIGRVKNVSRGIFLPGAFNVMFMKCDPEKRGEFILKVSRQNQEKGSQ